MNSSPHACHLTYIEKIVSAALPHTICGEFLPFLNQISQIRYPTKSSCICYKLSCVNIGLKQDTSTHHKGAVYLKPHHESYSNMTKILKRVNVPDELDWREYGKVMGLPLACHMETLWFREKMLIFVYEVEELFLLKQQ